MHAHCPKLLGGCTSPMILDFRPQQAWTGDTAGCPACRKWARQSIFSARPAVWHDLQHPGHWIRKMKHNVQNLGLRTKPTSSGCVRIRKHRCALSRRTICRLLDRRLPEQEVRCIRTAKVWPVTLTSPKVKVSWLTAQPGAQSQRQTKIMTHANQRCKDNPYTN